MIPTLTLDLTFSYDTSIATSSSGMAIANSGKKAKVLLLGRILAEDKVVKELNQLAEVTNIPPLKDGQEAKDAIAKAVEEDGPFDAVAVSLTWSHRGTTSCGRADG